MTKTTILKFLNALHSMLMVEVDDGSLLSLVKAAEAFPYIFSNTKRKKKRIEGESENRKAGRDGNENQLIGIGISGSTFDMNESVYKRTK